ncbi:MAG: MarR family transcriptional regulator [Butyrivibrio sp.]|nr:MarR family transcriptional regulator [Butyrivibrio sp.]
MEQVELISLLQASTLLSGVVLSCVDRKKFPFTKTQMNIFTVLDMEGDLSMKHIAQLLATSQEQATRTVAPLADAGYVERITDSTNRTRIYIHLTESGKNIIKESRKSILENLSKKINESLNEEDKSSLCEAALKITSLLERVN